MSETYTILLEENEMLKLRISTLEAANATLRDQVDCLQKQVELERDYENEVPAELAAEILRRRRLAAEVAEANALIDRFKGDTE